MRFCIEGMNISATLKWNYMAVSRRQLNWVEMGDPEALVFGNLLFKRGIKCKLELIN